MGVLVLLPLISVALPTSQEITREKILAADQRWQDAYDNFQPATDMVDMLKSGIGSDLRIDVYLGLWCPDSRRNLPPFIKIMDQLGTGVPVRYFDLPRKASRDIKYYIEDLKVERVPTFIFYRDAEEIGRIVENPQSGMLEDFMDIVLK